MQRTSIEWTDFSSNPIYATLRSNGQRGWSCTKVSPGCANCYASSFNERRGTGVEFLPENESAVEWHLNERELEAILRRKKPTRIFICDMTDLFHEEVPDEFLDRVFGVMAAARQHTFQVLTKRPERMRRFLTSVTARGAIWPHYMYAGQAKRCLADSNESGAMPWPLPNVWLGVSVENQRTAAGVSRCCWTRRRLCGS